MISIANPSARLQAFLGSAVTTDVKFTVGYFNMLPQTTADTARQLRTTIRTVSNGTSDVQIAPYPGQTSIDTTNITSGANNAVQNIYYVKVYNSNASSVTVTIQIEDGNDDIQIKATLGTLESLYYEDGRGWYSTDSSGAQKTSISQIPMAPLFLAYNSADDTNQTGNGATATVDFDTEVFDVTSNFASDTFTAPITGKYLLATTVQLTAIPAGCTQGLLRIVTSNRNYRTIVIYTAGTFTGYSFSLSAIVDMDAADTSTVQVQFTGGAGNTATIDGASELITFFCGVRVG